MRSCLFSTKHRNNRLFRRRSQSVSPKCERKERALLAMGIYCSSAKATQLRRTMQGFEKSHSGTWKCSVNETSVRSNVRECASQNLLCVSAISSRYWYRSLRLSLGSAFGSKCSDCSPPSPIFVIKSPKRANVLVKWSISLKSFLWCLPVPALENWHAADKQPLRIPTAKNRWFALAPSACRRMVVGKAM